MGYKVKYRDESDTTSGPSARIWADCPIVEILSDPGVGYYFFDDFLSFVEVPAGAEGNFGKYRGFASTGGSVVDAGQLGGAITFSSDGDNEGASLGIEGASFDITRDAKKLWFEARIKTSTIADTKHGLFCGLIEPVTLSAIVPIAANGTLADQNLVGFHKLEGDGGKLDTVYKADGVAQVTVKADAVTLAADTYVKVGMVYAKDTGGVSGSAKLTFFADGAPLADTKVIPNNTGTDFPADVKMGLVFALLNATGGTPGDASMDWWAIGQLR